MDYFKTEVGKVEKIKITEENFERATKKKKKYTKTKNGKTSYFAVCPLCDNPIQIVGLYKADSKRKAYGKHIAKDIEEVAKYTKENYFMCPYANPQYNSPRKSKKPRKKEYRKLYNTLKQDFDKIIYILEKTTGIHISYKFAESLLKDWILDNGWLYMHSTINNLPYMLLYANTSFTIVGRLITNDSKLYECLSKYDDIIVLKNIDEKRYSKITTKNDEYVDLTFRIVNHKFENGIESYNLKINLDGEDISTINIPVQQYYLYNLKKSNFENKKLLEIANRLMK